MPVAVELNGLLPGRGPGRGPRWPGAPGLGAPPGRGAPGLGAARRTGRPARCRGRWPALRPQVPAGSGRPGAGRRDGVNSGARRARPGASRARGARAPTARPRPLPAPERPGRPARPESRRSRCTGRGNAGAVTPGTDGTGRGGPGRGPGLAPGTPAPGTDPPTAGPRARSARRPSGGRAASRRARRRHPSRRASVVTLTALVTADLVTATGDRTLVTAPATVRLSRTVIERLLELAHHRCLDRRGRRTNELAHLFELGHDDLALYAELFREFVNPDLRHYAPLLRPFPWALKPDHQPIRRIACLLRVGLSSCRSSPCAHRALISFSTCFPYRFPSCLACFPSPLIVPLPLPSAMLCPAVGQEKVRSKRCGAERTRDAQCAGERSAPLRQFEAGLAGMQVRSPAGPPRLGVGHDAVPVHH